jgi:hypothetical protein
MVPQLFHQDLHQRLEPQISAYPLPSGQTHRLLRLEVHPQLVQRLDLEHLFTIDRL